MAEHVGTLLWEMRVATNHTLGQLARQAGISKSALSRWESGLRQPRLTELEAVLDALGASPEQRALALARIDAPRALRQLRRPTHAHPKNLGAPLTVGDLLRAMRARGGWTQEQVAERLDVARETLSRWESSERLPGPEQIQALFYALGAREQELVALTTGGFAEAPETGTTTSWEEKKVELEHHIVETIENRVGGLEELYYIQLDRVLWFWSLREPAARWLLAHLRTYHAHHHRMHERWELSHAQTQRAEEALRATWELPSPPAPVHEHSPFLQPLDIRIAILRAAAIGRGGIRPNPERGAHLLSPWAERSDLPAAYRAWIFSDLATYAARAGRLNDALQLAERACRIVEDDHPFELFLRQCDYAQLLLRADRVQDALRVIPDSTVFTEGKEAVEVSLLRADALRRAGHLAEAGESLAHANTLIETYQFEEKRLKAQRLAEQF